MRKTGLAITMLEDGRNVSSLQELRKAREQLSPRASIKEHSPSDTEILAQGDPLQTSDLQLCQRIRLCCFKPLSLWQAIPQK